uniref:Glycine zipper n=1 Tax=Candidatus Kentrum sp. SD TaxID=2126332 RepID=A0A451BMC1_9GAMM|nr:MAG: hypothetical protein BECKSD772F_GA0070984_10426 [Candidatus Kentron sp. SD]VFK44681.1 MAG: hypothetical protein BECKSD772E_GA0070983_10427 [Candidatus Kentron sp. SD]VFK79420.1 MAG: hypothetical protein BECKSD772D_GA0070982_10496 [Candidatus Kentron sp. SD]
MKYVCRHCGALNDIPDGGPASGYPCLSCSQPLSSTPKKPEGDTSAAVGMIGGATLGAAIGGSAGAIIGGIVGGIIGYNAKGVG